jgi:2-C-methyl-D-erythritol 2,4-cyclodiphosphate synthase
MGSHFPSSDPRWRDTAGADFLEAVAALLAAERVRVVSTQVVVIAEQPRLVQHLDAMRDACAAALGTAPAAIHLTATTTDGMGFAGRGEGIAASAVALLEGE